MVIEITTKGINTLSILTPYDTVSFAFFKTEEPFVFKKSEARFNLFLMLLYDYTAESREVINSLWKCNSYKEFDKRP